MKREKRLTKRERKASQPSAAGHTGDNQHIHCIACGRHLDASEFDEPATAVAVTCQHGSSFPSCKGCVTPSKQILADHDRTGQPPKIASAWH